MNNTWIWIVVVVVVVVGGFIWWQSMQPASTMPTTEVTDVNPAAGTVPEGTDVGTDPNMVGGDAVAQPSNVTVTYNGTSFTPSEVTIPKGGSVTWVNEGTKEMWVATGPHPQHTGYSSTSREEHCADDFTGTTPFDQCEVSKSYTFTFEKEGTWPYHNHIGGKEFGRVIVQ